MNDLIIFKDTKYMWQYSRLWLVRFKPMFIRCYLSWKVYKKNPKKM